jgi:hypothetical protein
MSLAFLRNRDVVLGSAATLALSIPSFAGLFPFSTIEVAGFVTGAILVVQRAGRPAAHGSP